MEATMSQLEKLEQLAISLHCDVRNQEPMRKHTTFKIGGPADLFIVVNDVQALQSVYTAAKELGVPCMVIGKGSNLLVKDSGIRGAVIQLGGAFFDINLKENNVLEAGAGASLATVCGYALQNAGADGEEMKDVVLSCTHMNPDGTIETFTAEQLDFAYRHSVYQKSHGIVLSVAFQLKKGDKQEIKAKMDDLMGRRKEKQPLEYPSAGSVFKRPVGYFAGTMIEQCGLKGKTVGGAMVSPKHAGFIVNTGNATCQDVLDLISLIQTTVNEQTGIMLECEIRAIGG